MKEKTNALLNNEAFLIIRVGHSGTVRYFRLFKQVLERSYRFKTLHDDSYSN